MKQGQNHCTDLCKHGWAQNDATACDWKSSKSRMLSVCVIVTLRVQTKQYCVDYVSTV